MNGDSHVFNLYGPAGLLARYGTSGRNGLVANVYYTFDPQGNVYESLIASANQPSVIYPNDFTPYDGFGDRLADINLSTGNTETEYSDPFGFVGSKGYVTDDDTGLDMLGHRYYIPQLGRFLTQDPIGVKGGFNLYEYAGDNPVTGIDPSGLDKEFAVDTLYQERPDIIHVADAFHIQPDLLAGVVWVEGYGGGVPSWNETNRALAVWKYAFLGHADLGLTKFRATARPGSSFSDRLMEASVIDSQDHENLIKTAARLQRLSAREYSSESDSLSPTQMAVVLTLYNRTPTPVRSDPTYSQHYGGRFMQFYSDINSIMSGQKTVQP